MQLFKNKRRVHVISAQTVERKNQKNMGINQLFAAQATFAYEGYITLVLLIIDDEMVTREFRGSWTLADLKKWEEL